MVTTTRPAHPLQAGTTPALLWVLLRALGAAPAVATILLLPALGHAADPLPPLQAILAWALALAAIVAARRLTVRSLNLRTPGALRTYTPSVPVSEYRTRVPDAIATAVATLMTIGALTVATGWAPGDHGVTALGTAIFAGAFAVTAACDVGVLVYDRLPTWRADTLRVLLGPAATAVALGYTGFVAAPASPDLPPRMGALLGVVVAVLAVTTRWFVRTADMRAAAVGASEAAADEVLERVNPAPTMSQRQQARRWGRFGLLALLGAGLVLLGALLY